MTQAELISKIKAEIERMNAIAKADITKNTGEIKVWNQGIVTAYSYVLSFLSALESEKPMQEGVEEETSRYLREECSNDDEPSISEVARHFYDLGCRRTAEKYDEIEYNRQREEEDFEFELSSEIEQFIKTKCVSTFPKFPDIARHFAKWGAERLAGVRKTLEIKPGDEVTINGHKFVYDKDKGYVTIVKSEESVPNYLEEAADNHIRKVLAAAGHPGWDWTTQDIADAFIAGAKWQAEHTPLPEDTVLFNKGVEEGKRLMMEEFEGNRLAACDSQTKEEYERETDFVDSIIKKEHRQPTFSDAINYGMRLQKEQTEKRWLEDRDGCFWDGVNEGKKAMKEQMMKEAVEGTVYGNGDYTWVAGDIPSQFKYGDKVRVIVLLNED